MLCVVSSLKDQSINLRVKAGFNPAVVGGGIWITNSDNKNANLMWVFLRDLV